MIFKMFVKKKKKPMAINAPWLYDITCLLERNTDFLPTFFSRIFDHISYKFSGL